LLIDGKIIKQEKEHRQGEKQNGRQVDKGCLLKNTGLCRTGLYRLVTVRNPASSAGSTFVDNRKVSMPIPDSGRIRTLECVGSGTKNPANRLYLSDKIIRGWLNDVLIPETPEQQRTEDKNIDKYINEWIDRF